MTLAMMAVARSAGQYLSRRHLQSTAAPWRPDRWPPEVPPPRRVCRVHLAGRAGAPVAIDWRQLCTARRGTQPATQQVRHTDRPGTAVIGRTVSGAGPG